MKSVMPTVLEFDYEIHTARRNNNNNNNNINGRLKSAINEFQTDLTGVMAEEYNVKDCGRRLGKVSNQLEQAQYEGLAPVYLGVESGPKDEIDPKICE